MMGRRGIMLGQSPSTEMEHTDEEDKGDDLYGDDDDDDDDNSSHSSQRNYDDDGKVIDTDTDDDEEEEGEEEGEEEEGEEVAIASPAKKKLLVAKRKPGRPKKSDKEDTASMTSYNEVVTASPAKKKRGKAKKKKKKKKKDLNKPKRNMNAFFFYMNANRVQMKKENADAKFGDIAKTMSAKFKALNETERNHWDKLAAADKTRYLAEMKNYIPPSDCNDHDDEPRKKNGKQSSTSTRMDDDDKSADMKRKVPGGPKKSEDTKCVTECLQMKKKLGRPKNVIKDIPVEENKEEEISSTTTSKRKSVSSNPPKSKKRAKLLGDDDDSVSEKSLDVSNSGRYSIRSSSTKCTKACNVKEKDVPKKRGPGRPKKEEGIAADTPHVEDVTVVKKKDSVVLGLATTIPSPNVVDSVGGDNKEPTKIIAQWLLKLLPQLTNQVALLDEYARHLFDGGFDSIEVLDGGFLRGNDLQFMKIGHRRVIEHHFSGGAKE